MFRAFTYGWEMVGMGLHGVWAVAMFTVGNIDYYEFGKRKLMRWFGTEKRFLTVNQTKYPGEVPLYFGDKVKVTRIVVAVLAAIPLLPKLIAVVSATTATAISSLATIEVELDETSTTQVAERLKGCEPNDASCRDVVAGQARELELFNADFLTARGLECLAQTEDRHSRCFDVPDDVTMTTAEVGARSLRAGDELRLTW